MNYTTHLYEIVLLRKGYRITFQRPHEIYPLIC